MREQFIILSFSVLYLSVCCWINHNLDCGQRIETTQIEYEIEEEGALAVEIEEFQEVDAPPYYIERVMVGDTLYIDERSLLSICDHVGPMYDIDPFILHSIAWVETGYRMDVNRNGLCQIVPSANTDRLERLGVTDLTDPYQNILCCADLMRELLDKTNDDMIFALMSYNMGYYKAKTYYPNYISSYPKKIFKQYEYLKGEKYE